MNNQQDSRAISNEVENKFASLTAASSFDAATEQTAIESGYIDAPAQEQESAQETVTTQTVEELNAEITALADTIRLESFAFVMKFADQFADLGANFVGIGLRVESMKADLRLQLEELRKRRDRRAAQDKAAQGELGVAVTEQVLIPALSDLLSGLTLDADGFDLDASVEVEKKDGEVVSITPRAFLGRVFMVQVNNDGTFTVLRSAPRVGSTTSKPKSTTEKTETNVPKAKGIVVDYVPEPLRDVVSVGEHESAKAVEELLINAGKLNRIAEETCVGTKRSYSVPERLRRLNIAFRYAA